MKKMLVLIVAVSFVSLLVTSCAGSRKGMGCPSSTVNRPFRS